MSRILSFGNINPKDLRENPIQAITEWFSSLDKFAKTTLVITVLLIVSTPFVINNLFNVRQYAVAPDKLEAEGGVLSAAGVQRLADSQASGGQYILFGTPTPTPTPTLAPSPTSGASPTPIPSSGGVVGYGAPTVGGTGGTVTNVSTYAEFRSCLLSTGTRVCKVTGSGIIDGGGAAVNINNPNITIDGTGSTAMFKDVWLQVRTSQVIIRNIRMRTGDLNVTGADADAISINGGEGGISNIVVDHVEAIWAPDVAGVTILNNVTDVTVQHSIIGVGLTKSSHPESLDTDGHNLAFNISGLSTTAWPKRVTVYRNLIIDAEARNPQLQGVEAVDLINNVIYNYHEPPHGNPRSANIVNNYYKWGPASQIAGLGDPRSYLYYDRVSSYFPTLFTDSVYLSGNVAANFTSTPPNAPANVLRSNPATPFSVTPESTTGLLDRILAEVGPDIRDDVTNQWITETQNGTGQYYNGDGYPAPNPHWP